MLEAGVIHRGFTDANLQKKIDALFACGVGDHVALPQLIVVGQQSSGKSSVLEGLTSLAFPRDSGLCTRFATQINFVRDPVEKISVSVIPSANASPEHEKNLKEWSKTNLVDLQPEKFKKIMKEVTKVMGLRDSDSDETGPTFSEDVFQLIVSGPDQQHLSVMDVPGIFKKTTDGLTTKEDIAMVDAMVKTKMKNPRSVILAVIPANQDIANQDILEMAKEVDPQGVRTLGVLTKPDLIDKGAERSILELFEGKRHRLHLGWVLTKNPGQKDLESPSVDRNTLEQKYFQENSIWRSLDDSVLGVDSLRARLNAILAEVIRQNFKQVRYEISTQLDTAKRGREGLGDARQTSAQQRQYLVKASAHFQEMVTDALTVRYRSNAWFDADSHRLATAVVIRNDLFQRTMHRQGQSYYSYGAESEDSSSLSEASAEETMDCDDQKEDDFEEDPEEDYQLQVREKCEDLDLDEVIYDKGFANCVVGGNIIDWLTEIHRRHRGFELGTFETSILSTAMKAQSERWTAICLGYISDITMMTHDFIKSLLVHILPDSRACEGIKAALMDDLLADYKAAYQQVEFLLRVEREGTPITVNHYFNENLEKQRQKRLIKAVEPYAFSVKGREGSEGSAEKAILLANLSKTHPMANEDHVVRDLKDILESYYKVARKRIVDNVCMQGADFHLVTGPKSPLRRFSPTFVAELTDDQLEDIAGEDEFRKRQRDALQKKIRKLETGKKILSE